MLVAAAPQPSRAYCVPGTGLNKPPDTQQGKYYRHPHVTGEKLGFGDRRGDLSKVTRLVSEV